MGFNQEEEYRTQKQISESYYDSGFSFLRHHYNMGCRDVTSSNWWERQPSRGVFEQSTI